MSTSCLLSTSTLTAQGAEAKIYKSTLHGVPILLKHRFPKKYRHPVLDGSLTKARIAGEARALMRCLK
jgi:TP53 regulating kinase and related kinases